MVVMDKVERRRSSCGRGVLKFQSWKPLPRPGKGFCEGGGQQVYKDKKEAQPPQNDAHKTPNVQGMQNYSTRNAICSFLRRIISNIC